MRATCEKRPGSLAAWVRTLFSGFSGKAETPKHGAPAWGCQCGVYGLSHLEGNELEQSPRVPGRDADRVVVALGVVLLWGRVIQHEHGYRAEYARPLKLLMAPPQSHVRKISRLLDAVAQRYSMQVVTRATELG